MLEPLPVTRFLGNSFGISNVSAYRVLSALAEEGILWRAPNGRYFQAGAKRLLDRPAPVACLFRRLERWTELSRMILEGADAACGDLGRALLLLHDRALFRQSDPASLTTAGTDEELHQNLEDFFQIYGERIHGILFDELWPDRILRPFQAKISNGVILHRRSSLGFLGSVGPDLEKVAETITLRAVEKKYARLVVLIPAQAYEPGRQAAEAIGLAAKQCGMPLAYQVFHPSATFPKRLSGLLQKKSPALVVATEDNMAVSTLDVMRGCGFAAPRPHGLMSTMGTSIATLAGITCAVTNFRKIGEAATHMAVAGKPAHLTLAPELFEGNTA